MSDLRQSLNDYLGLRHGFGYQLKNSGELLFKFVDFCDDANAHVVTIELALAWATLPTNCSRVWGACRLRAVRGFARYLHALDPRTEVPPTRLLPDGPHRVTPYLYSSDQVRALMEAARTLASPLRAATSETIIGLLATSGLRVGEALRLDRDDVDLIEGVVTIHLTKFHKTRLGRRPCLSTPSHTTGHAGPHPAVRHVLFKRDHVDLMPSRPVSVQ